MQPRLLKVMTTEDDLTVHSRIYRHKAFFQFIHVSGIDDALEQIAKTRDASQASGPVDILLLDVNMEKDASKKGWNWCTNSNVAPYGPLLTLPYFNAASHTQFSPYSEFWQHADVRENGYVLLCLAFLYSSIRRKPTSLKLVHRLVSSTDSPKIPKEALSRALVGLRRHLKNAANRGEIQLLDTSSAKQSLEDLKFALEDTQLTPQTSEFVKTSIDWVNRDGDIESVALTSLFADKFDYHCPPRTTEALDGVLNELNEWPAQKIRAWDVDYLRECATSILIKCANFEGEGNVLPNEVKKSPFVAEAQGDYYLLMRTVLLFAWVVAWWRREFRQVMDTWKSVSEIFYHGGKETTFDQRYKTYLGESREEVSYKTFRRPFRIFSPDSDEFVRQSYMLTENEPGCLRRADMERCREFAASDLKRYLEKHESFPEATPWMGKGSRPYPRWMNETEVARLRPGTQRVKRRNHDKRSAANQAAR